MPRLLSLEQIVLQRVLFSGVALWISTKAKIIDIFILKENGSINSLQSYLYSYLGLDDVYPKSFEVRMDFSFPACLLPSNNLVEESGNYLPVAHFLFVTGI